MNKLKIYRLYFTESDCYNSAPTIAPVGVQVHSTGANNPYLRRYVQPDDGRLGKNAYNNSHNRPGGDECASAYIGKLQDGTVAVYQALPWDKRCWLSAKGKKGSANKIGFIGFEVCEDALSDKAYFLAAMEQAALLTAYLCIRYSINPFYLVSGTSARAVSDHDELHAAGLASNHGDIGLWAKRFGWSMDVFRLHVSEYMSEGVEVEYIDALEGNMIFQVRYDKFGGNPDTTYLNLRSGAGTNYKSLARIRAYTVLDVVDNSVSGWYRVNYNGQSGYVKAEFCSVLAQTAKDEDYPTASGLIDDAELSATAENAILKAALKSAIGIVADVKDDVARLETVLSGVTK